MDVLQNTWIDPTSLEYIANQNPINNLLKQIVSPGRDVI
jgi:hypothetical protein